MTANKVPPCNITSKVKLFKKASVIILWKITKWPELEIGKNSVKDWTMPKMIEMIYYIGYNVLYRQESMKARG